MLLALMNATTHPLQTALQTMLPAGMTSSVCPAPERVAFEYDEEAACVAEAVAHRQREFLGGRLCLRDAMKALGQAPVSVPNNAKRMPLWPEGMVASISHSRGLCAAVAGHAEQYQLVGLDIEQTGRLKSGALKRVMHPDERAREGEDLLTGTLFFSAKEAFYKAQSPHFGESPAFHDLQLKRSTDGSSLEVVQTTGMSSTLADCAGGMIFQYRILEGLVCVLCWRAV